MALQKKVLDKTGWALLKVLQEAGRLSFSELGKRVGLSTPAVSERIRKMEDAGLITGYRAVVDLDRLNRPIRAFVSIRTPPGKNKGLITFMQQSPHVLEGHYITGQASFLIKIAVASIKEMEQFIGQASHYGATETSLIMSTAVEHKVIVEPVE